jgi:hypothetical protein
MLKTFLNKIGLPFGLLVLRLGFRSRSVRRSLMMGPIAVLFLFNAASSWSQSANYEFNDSHFHLTNNIQEGPGIREFVGMMGDKAGRAILSGIPLQQEYPTAWTEIVRPHITCTRTLHCTTTRLRTQRLLWPTSP